MALFIDLNEPTKKYKILATFEWQNGDVVIAKDECHLYVGYVQDESMADGTRSMEVYHNMWFTPNSYKSSEKEAMLLAIELHMEMQRKARRI